MKIIKNFCDYWGLNWKKNLLSKTQKRRYFEERLTIKEKDLEQKDFEQYLQILNEKIDDERERFTGIESKALQIVGQVSIVTTIIGLFAPFILDKIPSSYLYTRILLIIGVFTIVLLFVYAIICALRNSDVSKFAYAKGSENTVIEHSQGKIKFLKYEIINDKLFEIKTSSHLTDAKASNVIYASRAFKWAIILLLIYMVGYSYAILSVPDTIQKVALTPEVLNVIKGQSNIYPVINIQIDSTYKSVP